MHFEILVEDSSGKRMLESLVPRIIGEQNTFRVLSYKGIGRIPKGLKPTTDSEKRILLDQLPRILQGYGEAYATCADDIRPWIVVVCDLDDKCLRQFRNELLQVLNECEPKPNAKFCVAIEEGEAWLLGDIPAIRAAYPRAKLAVLQKYVNDSICGTWEHLADAVCPGGHNRLTAQGWHEVSAQKAQWAERISPLMNVAKNKSPSFAYFCKALLELVDHDD